jgi:valyl-tRNA synthetase
MVEKWPTRSTYPDLKGAASDEFFTIREIIKEIRNGRLENGIDPKKKITVILDTKNAASVSEDDLIKILKEQIILIKNLRTGIEKLEIISSGEKIENSIQRTVNGINIYIPLEGLIDVEKEKTKAENRLAELEKFIAGLESRLSNKEFVSKAPAEIIAQQKESLARARVEAGQLRKNNLLFRF